MRSAYSTPLGLLLAASLLAACAPLKLRPAEEASCPPRPARTLGEHEMLRYQDCLGSLPPGKLAQEHDVVSRHYAQTGSGADRVKLALLLAVPGTPFHSLPAARQMLVAGGPGANADAIPASLGTFARTLGVTLAQQQALEDRVQGLEKDLAAEKQRSDALQAQIDSIKNLERDMTRREPR